MSGGDDSHGSRTIVVAPNHEWASEWCRRQDPPVNVRETLIVTGRHNVYRLGGIRLEEHALEILGWPDNTDDYHAVYNALVTRGWHGGEVSDA